MADIPDTAVTLTLSNEELFFLINLLKIPEFPGIARQDVDSFLKNAEQVLTVQHSLQARGLLTITTEGEPAITVDETAAALLLNCAAVQGTLAMLSAPAEGLPRRALFNVSPYLIVQHTDPQPGVHQFTPIPDLKTLAGYVLTEAGVRSQQAPGKPWELTFPTAWLQAYRQAAREKGSQAGVAALARAGAPHEQARFFQTLLDYLTAMYTFVGVDTRPDGDGRGDAFSLLHSAEDSLWELRGAGENESLLRQIGANQAAEALTGLLRTILPAFFEGEQAPASRR